MKISSYYYDVLGVTPSANMGEIKKAYRALVRKNHPDLYPEPEKDLQELKMIQINEAYARITETLNHEDIYEQEELKPDTSNTENDWWVHIDPVSFTKDAVGFHKDIQYAYYKQGFDNFSRAVNGIKMMERNVSLKNDMYYLRRFARSLYYLRKADMYFSMLLEEYPDSIWSYDAYIKIKRIEFFNRFYRKILLNIERKLKERKKGKAASSSTISSASHIN